MSFLRLMCAGLFAACLSLAAPLAALAASPQDEVVAAYASWDEAFNKGDAAAVAAFYAPDAMFLPATHDVIKGPEGIQKFFAGLFGMGVKDHKLELIEARSEGNLIFAAAKWSATGKDAAGAAQQWGGVATQVFAKQPDGSLKVVLHTFN